MPAKWPAKLSRKEERLRAAAGICAKRDGWYKSIDGKTKYLFRPMPLAKALAMLDSRIENIRSGGVRTVHPGQITLKRLIEMFLASMWGRVKAGTMRRRTYDDYVNALGRFEEVTGGHRLAGEIGQVHFSQYHKTIDRRAVSSIRREIQYIDRLFNWAGPGKRSRNLIPFAIRGPEWVKPSDEQLSAAAAEADKSYSFEQLRAAFAAVADDPLLLAAAHLGFGSGFIPADIARLPLDRPDLDNGIIIFPRGKTGVSRICTLIPAGVEAMRNYLAYRAKFRNMVVSDTGLFFVTIYGNAISQYQGEDELAGREINWITKRWRAKVGLPFTGLRTTFADLVDDWPDQRAIDMVLGHKAGKMGKHIRTKHYAHRFSPERVRRLVEHAYELAFGPELRFLPAALPARLPAPGRGRRLSGATAASGLSHVGRSSSAGSSRPASARRTLRSRRRHAAP